MTDGTGAHGFGPLAAGNEPGIAALKGYLADGQAVAFLGAGVSAPLYPLWTGAITELIDHAVPRGLAPDRAAACRALARDRPDSVEELLRRQLGEPGYRAALRETFHVRREPDTARAWTPVQELVCRCPFRAVITTNDDPGIADARIRVRTAAVSTGFTTWTDELGLDRWRSGDVYGDAELPVLYAHGHHNQPAGRPARSRPPRPGRTHRPRLGPPRPTTPPQAHPHRPRPRPPLTTIEKQVKREAASPR